MHVFDGKVHELMILLKACCTPESLLLPSRTMANGDRTRRLVRWIAPRIIVLAVLGVLSFHGGMAFVQPVQLPHGVSAIHRYHYE